MDTVFEQLIESPQLVQVVERLQAVVAAERARRAEFLATASEGKKIEFINGRAVVHGPATLKHHNCSSQTATFLQVHVGKHGLGFVGHEKIMVSLTRNDYEPDICFFGRDKAEGFKPEQMRFPAPDLVVEVLSPSTEVVDRGIKFQDYAAHGVLEYWMIEPDRRWAEQYILEDGRYVLRLKSGSGRLVSVAVPGFDIPIAALFNEAVYLTTLQQILAA